MKNRKPDLSKRSKSRATSARKGKHTLNFGIVSRDRNNPELSTLRIKPGRAGIDLTRNIGLVKRLALDGYTDDVIARVAGVSPETLDYWRVTHPELQDAIDTGRTAADAEVAAALYQLAVGYEREVTEIHGKDADKVRYSKYFPPDRSAIKDWMATRNNKRFRPQPQQMELTGKGGKALMPKESKSELIASIVKMVRPKADK